MEKSKKLPIKWVNYGIANRFDTYIEVNEALKKFPKLLKQILDHEHSHTDKWFSVTDLLNDVYRSKINNLDLILFLWNNKSTWISFAPIYYQKDKGIVYDVNALIIYFFSLLLISGTIYFGYRVLF